MAGNVNYKTNDTFDYSGVLTGGVQGADDDFTVEAGSQYALAKYDGQNAGYVLYFLGGEATTLPQYSETIWGSGTQWALSHYVAFGGGTTSLSEPGTLGLMMIGMVGVGALRRRRSVK